MLRHIAAAALVLGLAMASPLPASADMDVSFKAKLTSSGEQNYGTESWKILTLSSAGTTDVVVNRVEVNRQDVTAQCTNVKIPCRMPPGSSLVFKLPASTVLSEITVHTDGGPVRMRTR
ncbi:MAG: hypothetical protein K6E40_07660 [Desulfovibrio sp.]|nr:hypothetical protein [Desulfovibrio sp.]